MSDYDYRPNFPEDLRGKTEAEIAEEMANLADVAGFALDLTEDASEANDVGSEIEQQYELRQHNDWATHPETTRVRQALESWIEQALSVLDFNEQTQFQAVMAAKEVANYRRVLGLLEKQE